MRRPTREARPRPAQARTAPHGLLVAMLVAAFVGAPSRAGAQPIATFRTDGGRALFELHSAFWLNLHHHLYVLARARRGDDATRETTKLVLADTAGVGALSADDRAAWEDAVAYYTRTLADRDAVFDTAMVHIETRLAAWESAARPHDASLDPELVRHLEGAAHAYRAVWWPRHDAANRAWTAALQPLVARHGDSLALGVSRAFRTPWSSVPVRVDVSGYANWAGAYTTEHPSHVTMSSRVSDLQGTQALETLFHETLHTMEDSVGNALRVAARAQGSRVPRDLTHALIFYTAGAVTQRAVPGHVPYAEQVGLWTRVSTLGALRPTIVAAWQPYLDGRVSFDSAVRTLVRAPVSARATRPVDCGNFLAFV